jgi:hypothetical protein
VTDPTASAVTGGGCTNLIGAKGIEGTGAEKKLTGVVDSVASDGTVVVGCARFSSAGAVIFVDGLAGSISDIHPGQVVTIVGTLDLQSGIGRADSIYVHESIAGGPLSVVRLGTTFAPTARGTWYMFDGPEFAVSPQATVLVDGEPASVSGLVIGEGEVVLITGTESFDTDHNPGGLMTADRLEIAHLVDGPVDALDLAHGRLVVLGQTVIFDGGTFVEPTGNLTSLGSIQAGDRLTVSGHPSQSGEIVATRIAPSARTGAFLVSGIVQSLNMAQHRFALNGLAIDYRASQLLDLPAGGPTNGDRVMVRGVRPTGSSALVAFSVQYQQAPLPGPSNATASLHGIVTSVTASSAVLTVTVDGHPIIITEPALTACGSPTVANADVRLEGRLRADGTLVADQFCFSDSSDFSPLLTGRIDSIDPIYGTLSVLGIRVQPSITTRVIEKTTGLPIALADLRSGDFVEIAGAAGPVDGLVIANVIRRSKTSLPSLIRVADYYISVHDPLIYVLSPWGLTITTDAYTSFQWINSTNHAPAPLSRDIFFAGSRSWPFWDKICRPSVSIKLKLNGDGSLTAISVLVEPDYC